MEGEEKGSEWSRGRSKVEKMEGGKKRRDREDMKEKGTRVDGRKEGNGGSRGERRRGRDIERRKGRINNGGEREGTWEGRIERG